jgi:hypothetical protein
MFTTEMQIRTAIPLIGRDQISKEFFILSTPFIN